MDDGEGEGLSESDTDRKASGSSENGDLGDEEEDDAASDDRGFFARDLVAVVEGESS